MELFAKLLNGLNSQIISTKSSHLDIRLSLISPSESFNVSINISIPIDSDRLATLSCLRNTCKIPNDVGHEQKTLFIKERLNKKFRNLVSGLQNIISSFRKMQKLNLFGQNSIASVKSFYSS